MKILCVDDSATARLIVKRTLEAEGHRVLEASDGAVALSVLDAQPDVACVVLDSIMPVMNGMNCLKAIRKRPDLRHLKVVMCATEAERDALMAAIKAGANGYVLKPVTVESLIDGIDRAMGRGREGDGGRQDARAPAGARRAGCRPELAAASASGDGGGGDSTPAP